MTALLSVMMMFSTTANASTDKYAAIQGLVFISSYHAECEPLTQTGQVLFGYMYNEVGGDSILYSTPMIEATVLVQNFVEQNGQYNTCILIRELLIEYGLYTQLFR
jgi:hypothetical protein